MPFRSLIVHPNAVLCSLRTLSNSSSSLDVKEELIITGKLSSSPRKAYLRVKGRGLSSCLCFSSFESCET
ncbi:hypothetical protein PIB30_110381, partial [Stylosanthes scabra]|nr:hypothetical protein [Stylosanthes scabra]